MAGLLNSTTRIRPTELERRYGRYLRSPEGHDPVVVADPPAADPPAADPPADPPAASDPPADPLATVLGAAATDPADPPADPPATPPVDPVAVPEAYDLKLTVAGEDGKETEVAIDTALLEAATPTLKELGLTNEQANKIAGLVPKIQERLVEQQNDAFAETRTAWAKQAQDDPEIGGKNWKSTVQLSARALDHFVGPAVTKDDKGNEVKNDFRQLLDDTGLGNHPAMIRFCRKVGEGLAEDGTLARGSEGPRAKPSRLEALYPDDVKK